jgi:probable F420-dependent oxidoreductase
MTLSEPPGSEVLARARDLEEMGYGTINVGDHIAGGLWAPLVALAGAAATTSRVRLSTNVLANGFRNPLLLAREIATLDVLSGGRFELGIGAGWASSDFESLGIPFEAGGVRVDRLGEAIRLLKRFFTEDEVTHAGTYYRHEKAQCRPRTVQRPHPPILIAASRRQLLALAGREADIVRIFAAVGPDGMLRDPASVTFEAARERIEKVRAAAGDRFDQIELSMSQDFALADDPEREIDKRAETLGLPREAIANSIYRPTGSLEFARSHLLRLARELGVTYFAITGPVIDELAPLVRELSGTVV